MKKDSTRNVAFGGMIAALYVVLTYVANLFGLASGAIQVRLSEALTIMPVFTVAAIPGLAVGCVLANLLTGCLPLDIVFGSAATLIGAIGTRLLRKRPYLAWIPPVVSNAVIVPFVLLYYATEYEVTDPWAILVLTVGAGEIISCGLLGMMLYQSLKKAKIEF